MRGLVLAAVVLSGPGEARAAETLLGASSDDHLWVAFEVDRPAAPAPRYELRHHARTMEGPWFGKGLTLGEPPAAMAAWGNQLWLVFEPSESGRPGQPPARKAATVEVEQNPGLGIWFHRPHDWPRALASLDGRGRLVDLVGTADGPVAFIRPPPRLRGSSEPDPGPPTLSRLRGSRWDDVPLPAGFEPGPACRLAAGGRDGADLLLLDALDGETATLWRRADDDTWTQSSVPLPVSRVRGATRVGASTAVILLGPQRVEVAYVRPRQLLDLGAVATPSRRWVMLGLRDGIRLLERSDRGELTMRTMDPVGGETGPRETMTAQPLMTGRVLHLPLLFAVAITVLMLVFLFKPGTAAVTLAPDTVLLGPMPRLFAVVVDLGAGGAIALATLDASLPDLLDMPLWTTDLADSVPSLVMIGATVAHSTLSELAWARTLGKTLVGARVVAVGGGRPGAAAVLARNAIKALVLVVPVLAVLALLNPNLQGIGDSVARTLVVRDAAGRPGGDGNDR